MQISLLGSFLLLSVVGLLQVENGESAKILSIAFMASKSHRITYDILLRELARRGHEVTVLSPIKSKDEKNFKNILTISEEDAFNRNTNNLLVTPPSSLIPSSCLTPYVGLAGMISDLCEKGYELPVVRQVLEEKWDLVYVTPMLNECLWGLIYKLNTTFVIHQQMSVMPWTAAGVGTPSPPSFVPITFAGYSDSMSFYERTMNLVGLAFNWLVMELRHNPKMESIYRRALNDPTIPSINEIMKNTSLVLSTNHVSTGKPRPLMPDIIEIGGIYLSPAKPVEPKELDDYLTDAEEGFIYFSMGTFNNGSTMTEARRQLFLNVFSKLKQRILWKWETEMEDAPPNVRISKWLPQPDILGHKNIRLFLTHGGLGGVTEAIYHGVPLVGIPVIGDQPQNLAKAAKAGFAVPAIGFRELTEEALLKSINTILNDPSYHENAKKLSAIYKDQIDSPLERAVYWIEYVLRHKGALHLRSAARDLNFFQYYSLDVLAVILIALLVLLKVNILIVKAILGRYFRSRKQEILKQKLN